MLTMSSHHSLIPHLRRLVGVVQAILGKPVLLASTGMSAYFFPSGLNMARNGEATTVSIIQRHMIEKEHCP